MSALTTFFALLVAALAAAPAHAQPTPEEAKVKAAFLQRFVQYVEWPAESLPQADSPVVIGIAGAGTIAADLKEMTAGRAAPTRRLSVRPVKSPDDLAGLHVLFIGADDASRMPQYMKVVRGRRVLVVTEAENALDQGSMINFVIADRRVRFEIALDAAEKAGLVVSSKLLAVAMRVHKGELPPPRHAMAVAPAPRSD